MKRDLVREEYLKTGAKKTSSILAVGNKLWIQCVATGLWDIPGTITGIRNDKRSYYVLTDKGTKTLRNS